MSGLGSEIRKLREKKGLTLAALAAEVDIPVSCLEDVENGRRCLGVNTLRQLARVLEVDDTRFISLADTKGEKIERETGEYISSSAGRKIRQVREEMGLTLVECSKRAGISYTHISEIERGNVCPSLKTLEKLAKALEKPVSYFLKGDSPVSLGERVRKLREAQGLTQVKLAAQLGISDSLIAQIETGKVQPSLNTLEKLADTLGVSVDYFLANPQEINSDAPNIVPIEQWVNLKKNRNRIEMFKEAEEWQQELALNIMELINKSLPGRMEVPADPITLEIASLLKELPVEKKKSVLDYIKFIASKEEVQANY
ncbi:MAG TPA: transcriptional regulator [Clostridia bacterium]|nr:transcriptional regulator [Clostridia bacterium]